MLKVANVIMEGRFGGPQARITAVAEKVKQYGIETIVVFPKKNAALFYKKLSEKDVPIRQLSLHRLTKQKSHLMKFIAFFIPELFFLYKLFKKERVDIVHCNGSWQIKGIIAGKLAGAKLVWHLNDTGMPFFLNIIFKFLAVNFCDAVITAGQRVRDYYLSDEDFTNKPIMEIQAPVDTSVFDPSEVKTDYRIAGYPGLKIVTVGNINPLKGIEYYIGMASILSKRYEKLNFFVVGAHLANQRKYSENISRIVENLTPKNFHFYGPTEDVPSVLKGADIYVCSSIAEASPISVWEAMSMAKAIVSSDVGDVPRFIRDGESGFIVSTKDAAALAKKVGVLVENRELRERFGHEARDVAVKYLDVDICAKKHAQFYRAIINKL